MIRTPLSIVVLLTPVGSDVEHQDALFCSYGTLRQKIAHIVPYGRAESFEPQPPPLGILKDPLDLELLLGPVLPRCISLNALEGLVQIVPGHDVMIPIKVDQWRVCPVVRDPGRVEQGNRQRVRGVQHEPEIVVRRAVPPEETVRACHECRDDVKRMFCQRIADETAAQNAGQDPSHQLGTPESSSRQSCLGPETPLGECHPVKRILLAPARRIPFVLSGLKDPGRIPRVPIGTRGRIVHRLAFQLGLILKDAELGVSRNATRLVQPRTEQIRRGLT